MTQPKNEGPLHSSNEQPTVIQEHDPLAVRGAPDVTPGAVSEPAILSVGDEGTPLPLSRVGEYEILSTIGRGGMGVVFKARHVRLGRLVALKMLSGGLLARPEDIHRFENEAAAAAQLQHASIVALFEVGNYEGQPYFSMEFVQGSSLAGRLILGSVPGRMAAGYLERVARAVHYAHSRGILHRDLKPANILLDENDQPKITDFGLAKLMHGDSGQTRTGTVMGTPSYMAPEQANARKDIGPPCDVYSLGAILYELVTGKPPFQGETALDTLRRVATQEPTAPHLLNPSVDRDLETICLKCLEKDPGRRYASAAALADDLHRYLRDEPITARRMSVVGRGLKWAQRNPALAALLFVTLAALAGFGVFQWHVAEQERQLREDADNQRQIAERQTKEALKSHQEVLAQQEISRHFLYVAQMGKSQQAWDNADLQGALTLLKGWVPKGAHKDLRQWEWHFLHSLCQGNRAWPGHAGRASAAAYRPDGKQLATVGGHIGKPGEIKIWDVATGKLLHTLPQKHTNMISALAYSPDGETLATASDDHTVWLWDPGAGKELAVLKGHASQVTSVAFAAKGKLLASAGVDRDIIIWDLSEPGEYPRRHTLKGHGSEITSLAFHPEENRLASSSFDETVRLWNADTGKLLKTLRGHEGEVHSVAFHAHGKVLISGGGPGRLGGQLKRWDLDTGAELKTHDGLAERVLAVACGQNGHVAAAGNDGFIYLWDEKRSTEPIRFKADTRLIYGLAFSPDGKRLATAGGSGLVRVWNSSGSHETRLLPGHKRTECVAFSPKGRLLAAAGRDSDRDGEVYLFDMKSGELIDALKGHDGNVNAVAFSPDEKLLASGGDDQTIRLHHLNKRGLSQVLRGHKGRVMAVAFSPAENFLASAAAEDEDIVLWDLATGKEKQRLKGHRIGVLTLAFSPNGRYLASAGYDKTVIVWDLQEGASFSFSGHGGTIQALAFSPDSSQIASGGVDQTIIIWDLKSKEEYQRLEGSTRAITGLAYHPRGQRLVSVGPDRIIRLWNLLTRQEILHLAGPTGSPRSVAFSPDGWQLVVAGDYPAIHLWDARP